MVYEIMKDSEAKACVDLAAAAFGHYDFFSIYVPSDKRRPAFLKSMLGTEVRVNRRRAHFLTAKEDGQIVAFAMLRPPEYRMPGNAEYLKAGFWKNLLIGGYRNVAAWFEMDQKAGVPCGELGGETWFLNILTVAPEKEGKGIGSRMLHEAIIPYAQQHGAKTLCLYTNSEINRKFYTRNGFQEFHAQQFSYKGKTLGSWSYKMDI